MPKDTHQPGGKASRKSRPRRQRQVSPHARQPGSIHENNGGHFETLPASVKLDQNGGAPSATKGNFRRTTQSLPQFTYVNGDLKRIVIISAIIVVILMVLGIVL